MSGSLRSGQRKGKHFLVLKFCSLRLARNSSWSGEPGPSSFVFQLRPGWIYFSVSLLFIFFNFIIFLDFLVMYIFQ
jgi:hypothetical protein